MEFKWRYIIWIFISLIVFGIIGDYISLYCGQRGREIFGMKMIGDSIGLLLVFFFEGIYQLVKLVYQEIHKSKE